MDQVENQQCEWTWITLLKPRLVFFIRSPKYLHLRVDQVKRLVYHTYIHRFYVSATWFDCDGDLSGSRDNNYSGTAKNDKCRPASRIAVHYLALPNILLVVLCTKGSSVV
jgi:hypothetical protein